jgi:hypothetical protein
MRLKAQRFHYPAGTEVYLYTGYDYGLARDDFLYTGEFHDVVTTDPNGEGPFFTVPTSMLERP